MGSGSYGGPGGGGGGSGGASGWATSSNRGGYTWDDGRISGTSPGLDETRNAVRQTLRRMPREYLKSIICSELLRGVYEELFEFSVHMFENRTWDGIEEDYGVAGEKGCLVQWVAAIVERHSRGRPDEKVLNLSQQALDGFLERAMGGNPADYARATSRDALAQLDQQVFKSTSGYFLGFVIWHLLEAEPVSDQPGDRAGLRQTAQEIADRIIESFENQFLGVDQTTYRHLFRVACRELEWFLRELRR